MKQSQAIDLCYDAGNRWQLLAAAGGEILKMPAVIYRAGTAIPHGNRAGAAYITVDEETYILGDRTIPKARSVHQEDLGDDKSKVRNAKAFILAMSAALGERVDIGTVHMMHPNPTPDVVQSLNEALKGEHKVLVNGKQIVRNIKSVSVYAEPIPSYYYLVEQGLIDVAETIVLYDIGGKTAVMQAFSNGMPIADFGRLYLSMGGVKALAMRLADAISAKKLTKGVAPNLDTIMDALEYAWTHTPPDQKRQYFYGQGYAAFDFTDLVGKSIKNWLESDLLPEFAKIQADFGEYLSRIWFVGGGANYVRPISYENPMCAVADEPELTNIRGLLAIANREVLQQIGCPLPQPELV